MLTGSTRKLPQFTSDLIDELNALFPPRCVQPQETLVDAQRYAGKRDVVEFLLSLRKHEAEKAANPATKLLR